jgi:hypothetical protein
VIATVMPERQALYALDPNFPRRDLLIAAQLDITGSGPPGSGEARPGARGPEATGLAREHSHPQRDPEARGQVQQSGSTRDRR